jgi:hypothetical protein
MVRKSCVRFVFISHGAQADSFAEPADCLYLDVGNRFEPGIIDHHHLPGYAGSTTRLVWQHPELIDGAVSLRRTPTDPYTIVLHCNPDLDCFAATYLAMAYPKHQAFPPHAETFVPYVDQVDQGYPGMSHAQPFALVRRPGAS